MKLNKKLLPISPVGPWRMNFGDNLDKCKKSIDEVLSDHDDSRSWYTVSPYNAGQAVTLLELAGYSFHLGQQCSDEYYIQIFTELSPERHYIDVDKIDGNSNRILFEQGRYDALMELLGKKYNWEKDAVKADKA